jgi:hypothetical protein
MKNVLPVTKRGRALAASGPETLNTIKTIQAVFPPVLFL